MTRLLDPTGKPVGNWNGIPILPQATVGEEFNKSNYGFQFNVTAADVQTFYTDRLHTLGWTSVLFAAGSSDSGGMPFMRGSNILAISITSSDKGVVVGLYLQ